MPVCCNEMYCPVGRVSTEPVKQACTLLLKKKKNHKICPQSIRQNCRLCFVMVPYVCLFIYLFNVFYPDDGSNVCLQNVVAS
jgi:hypothetical protein